ncbi:MAG: SpoIIE family protein phosphatase, partial [Dehalococcoidales bacterium]|nr:SpoIIE family protein phosphatase [Dehalococcoidales bacterium]
GELTADWRYIPSSELGGDAFGYRWVDADHFAIFLLDVCSHGVGAALLSISVMNVLRSQNLPGVDFRQPGEVMAALNRAFGMESQNNLYFTMWYGVVNKSTRQLHYSSGGHPPRVKEE